jgi:hypothetical protein
VEKSGKWKLENRKWNGRWIFEVEKLKKKRNSTQRAQITQRTPRREVKS